MESRRKRLTLDLEAPVQRRLKAVAALKGVSMREYCQTAIDKELTRDEARGLPGLPQARSDAERFADLREKYFGGKPLPGTSVDLVREAREIRNRQRKDGA